MFSLRREIANDVAAVFRSEESLSSLLPLPHHSITPAPRSHSLSFCGGPPEADVGCKKKHAKKEHATRVPPQEEPRPTTAATTFVGE